MTLRYLLQISGILLFVVLDASALREVDDIYTSAAERTVTWLSTQRQEYGWGEYTPRALVALELARLKLPYTKELEAMAKLLKVQTAANLLKHRNINKQLPITEIASSVNALLATCQNPRNFHGRDLVSLLRFKANEATATNHKISPFVLLTLCLGELPEQRDMQLVYENVKERRSDISAIGVMTMTCLYSSSGQKRYGSWFETAFQLLQESMHNFTSGDTVDVYTTALIAQAINGGNFSERFRESGDLARKSLLERQNSDGSFDDVLASYYAVPALLGLSLLDLKDICTRKSSNKSDFLSTWFPAPLYYSINYALWINKNHRTVTHSRDFLVASNWTFFDVMRLAKSKSKIFNFSYDNDENYINVYSLAGIPNDPEKSLYWELYVNPLHSTDALRFHDGKYFNGRLDELKIYKGDRFVFVFAGYSPHGIKR